MYHQSIEIYLNLARVSNETLVKLGAESFSTLLFIRASLDDALIKEVRMVLDSHPTPAPMSRDSRGRYTYALGYRAVYRAVHSLGLQGVELQVAHDLCTDPLGIAFAVWEYVGS